MKGYLTPGWVFQVPAIKANLFPTHPPLVDSMIKKEHDFIKDNLVDISALVQLGVGKTCTALESFLMRYHQETKSRKGIHIHES